MLTEGEFEGHQAIVIRPAKPFEFMKLSAEVRNRIYNYYFGSKGVVGEGIVLDGKRSTTKDVYAKTYANSLKHRVGILTVSKEVRFQSDPSFTRTWYD